MGAFLWYGMNTKNMVKKAEKKAMVAPPSALYRRIAFSFIGAAVVLLGVVSYYSFARVTIIVKPKREALSAPLTVDVRATPQEGEIRGVVGMTTVEAAETFPVTGSDGQVAQTQAQGTVTIKNTTNRNQPLVRTTRLLTPEGVLFHTSETVLVPAQGNVTVGIYADEPGPGGEVLPTRFTIPGLWEGLQDQIYAESTERTCCGTKTVRLLTDDDLKAAAQELEVKLTAEARESLRTSLAVTDLDGEILLPEIVERTSDTEPGKDADHFTVGLTIKVTGIFYDRAALMDRSKNVLAGLAGPEEALVEVDPDRMTVTADRYDAVAGTARLSVDAVGLLALRPDSDLFLKDRLVGLDRAALESYFDTWESVESVRVEFRPSWLRRVPRLKDHIEIKIQD